MIIEIMLAEITLSELPALHFIFHGKQGSYLNVIMILQQDKAPAAIER